MNFLIVRLGALGDIVHAIPAAAALRRAFPGARIDWLVDRRHRELLDLVPVIDRVEVLETSSVRGWMDVVRRLRATTYDAALDLQGLLKSAVLARASGAARVVGFSLWHLREKSASPFYSESVETRSTSSPLGGHVIRKNLGLLRAFDIIDERIEVPLSPVQSAAADIVREAAAGAPVALINPGAAWPNKRWSAERLGETAAFLREVRGYAPFVLWGPGEEARARAVVDRSSNAARMAPATRLSDLVALCREAALMISGDTGPLHIASAVGTPIVSIFGPTDPDRNGPWSEADVSISRYASCRCHYERRCTQAAWCLDGVTVAEVTAAIQLRTTGRRDH
ncbi:MAG TPA: glycosyltransferase family 9 protein [Vicinamibacterales bacterium]|nr:glycosyltransferase family 9 protein [Vicinamibacterales bacterium]